MSHFTTLKTRLTEAAALVQALADMGFPEVEQHEEPRRLFGFEGLPRPQKAEVIVRRKHVGWGSNDLGFRRQPDGAFDALISSFDRRKYSPAWLGHLSQRYAYHVAKAKLAEQGFALVTEETQPNAQIHLVLRRMA